MAGKDAKVCLSSRFICKEEVRALRLGFHANVVAEEQFDVIEKNHEVNFE